MNHPFVSILIAARNEEDNIYDLLNSLNQLNYPTQKLQILIGNDDSADNTQKIVDDFIENKSHFQLINITKKLPNLIGKTNVLAQLAHFAKGEYFFFTDADIEVPKFWIETMLESFGVSTTDNRIENKSKDSSIIIHHSESRNVGIVIGITIMKSKNWFETCQAIEWLFALKMMENFSKFSIPTTGMGNNMAVSAEAYWATGGFEKIPFSIVEDYAIYKAIIEKGYRFCHTFDKDLMTITKPPKNYFEQRKRWVHGGLTSRSNLIFPSILQGLAMPILLIISIFNWKFSVSVFSLNMIVNFIVGYSIFKKLNVFNLLKYIPSYTFYMYFFWFLQFVYYFLPTKLIWKGREY